MDGDDASATEEPPPRAGCSSTLLSAVTGALTEEDDARAAVARAVGLLVPDWLDGCEVRLSGSAGPLVGAPPDAAGYELTGLDVQVAAALETGDARRTYTTDGRPVDVLPLRARARTLGALVLVGGLEDWLARTLAGLVALRLDAPSMGRDDGAVHESRLALDAAPQSARVARALVRDVLSGNGMAAVTDTALLLVSELVSNALRHGVGPYELHATSDLSGVVVSVSDRSPASPRPRRPVHDVLDGDPAAVNDPSALDEDGRGLLLVEALADDWGWAGSGAGKRVWFRLDRA